MRLSELEIDALLQVATGKQPELKSSHRVRLEMLGLVKDGPGGLSLTEEGQRAARSVSTFRPEKMDRPPLKVDKAGKKLMHQRGHAI